MSTTENKRDPSELASLDDWLDEEGIKEEVKATATSKLDDLLTRPYAKVGALSAGNVVKVDPDFAIGEADEQYTIKQDDKGLYIETEKNNYYLEPFIRGGGKYYLGIYLVD